MEICSKKKPEIEGSAIHNSKLDFKKRGMHFCWSSIFSKKEKQTPTFWQFGSLWQVQLCLWQVQLCLPLAGPTLAVNFFNSRSLNSLPALCYSNSPLWARFLATAQLSSLCLAQNTNDSWSNQEAKTGKQASVYFHSKKYLNHSRSRVQSEHRNYMCFLTLMSKPLSSAILVRSCMLLFLSHGKVSCLTETQHIREFTVVMVALHSTH